MFQKRTFPIMERSQAVTWNPEYPSAKVRWTLNIQRGVVTGNGVWLDPPDLENLQTNDKFKGRLVEKGIKGNYLEHHELGSPQFQRRLMDERP